MRKKVKKMKVLLRKNIAKLGQIGEVVEVKPGYARNYLLPSGLAVQPSEVNLKAVEAEKQEYAAELAKLKAELEARAAALEGKEITISVRATDEGHLYGSVGPAQICALLVADGVFVEPENIVLDSPIRRLDKYDVVVRLADDVAATIHVWVLPVRDSEEEQRPEDAPADASDDSGQGEAGTGEEDA